MTSTPLVPWLPSPASEAHSSGALPKLADEASPLVRSLGRIGSLSDAEVCVLDALIARKRTVSAGEDIVSEGDRPSDCCLIVEGFACRYKLLSLGRRQVMSFHIAGDICDLHSFPLGVMDHSIGAITSCSLGVIPHQALRSLIERHPQLGRLLWRSTLIDAAVFREWMAGIGRKSALGRVAHLLCELFKRLEAVGLAAAGTCELPMTQTDIADALGLTNVHVNRVLKQLRSEGMICSQGSTLVIQQWEQLKRVAEFDEKYLHLRPKNDASATGQQ